MSEVLPAPSSNPAGLTDVTARDMALPAHIAIIMDGNGRWAQERGLSRSEGHKAGVRAARDIVTECRKLGLRHLTLYTFSQENWGRPQEEIRLLFQLLVTFLREEIPQMERQSIRLCLFGEIDALPLAARKTLLHAVKRTSHGEAMTVNLALNYSGREEILRAARLLLAEAARNPECPDLTEARFREYLYSAGQPDPDLIIRTSGELRLSNYLTFQSAYSELYFTDVYWPDFSPAELHTALASYAARRRRFGLTQEQMA